MLFFQVFEPSELERGHLTDQDHQIRKLDIPERFQLRRIPVTRTRGDGDDRSADKELTQEAKWIYHHAFFRPFISNQVVNLVLLKSINNKNIHVFLLNLMRRAKVPSNSNT